MKFTYAVLTLFILSLSNPVFSQQTEEQQWWQSLLGGAGQSLTTMSAAGQAATMKRIEDEIERTDKILRKMGINGEKCSSECKNNCMGAEKYCKKLSGTDASCNCATANEAASTCTGTAKTTPFSACSCVGDTKCESYTKCKEQCKARSKLSRAKYLNWNSLLALAGVAATTASKPGLEDKRTCEEKCGSLSGKEKQVCLEGNTNEYGESCAYTIPTGQCDDTDPIVKDGTCAAWDGGCDLYKRQCACNLRATQLNLPYVWDPDKNDCVKITDSTSGDGSFGSDTSDTALAAATDEEDKKAADAKAAGGAALGSSSGGLSGSKGGLPSGSKDAKASAARPKGTTLSQKDQASFSPQTYSGYVGETGAAQGTTDASKKPEDIAASDTKETLLEIIHKMYVDYTTAGRFLSADVKIPDKKDATKTKRIKKKV